jgi:hypothetical protein
MIKKSKLNLLVLSCFLSVIALCIVGCYFIYSADLTDSQNRKFCAEILIFLSILLLTVITVITIYALRQNTRIYLELDKLATFCRTHDIREGAGQLRHLDKLGKKMSMIFDLINETGEKRKQKLASMYQIIDYLMTNSDKNILITNVIGDIQFCSHKFSTVTKIDSDLIRTYRISDLLEISINRILSDFERKKTTDIALKNQILKFDDTSKKIKEVHILPIFDSDNIVSNMIFLFNFS